MTYKNQDYVSHGWYCECGQHLRCDQRCCDRFLLISKAEALAQKLPDSQFLYNNTFQVIVEIDGGRCRLVGYDGGEPEDQLLCRDWEWVVPALNAAYEAGYKAGKLGGGSEELK